jgi:hypothetical protein
LQQATELEEAVEEPCEEEEEMDAEVPPAGLG